MTVRTSREALEFYRLDVYISVANPQCTRANGRRGT